METKFNFKSQICTTREQSERLLALGLKKETSDMHHWQSEGKIYTYVGQCSDINGIPAWSLGRLVEIINKCNFESFESEKWKREAKKFCRYVLISYSDDLIETSIEIIEALIEKGYFNKEYLE